MVPSGQEVILAGEKRYCQCHLIHAFFYKNNFIRTKALLLAQILEQLNNRSLHFGHKKHKKVNKKGKKGTNKKKKS